MKDNRAQFKRPSVIGRGKDDITTNLVSKRPFFFVDAIAMMLYQYTVNINE